MDQAGESITTLLKALAAVAEQHPDLTIGQLREMLSDTRRQAEAAPIARQIAEAAAPMVGDVRAAFVEMVSAIDAARDIARQVMAATKAARTWLVQICEAVPRLPQVAAALFERYRRQIETAGGDGIPPLTAQGRTELLALALLMQLPEEADEGVLPPLEQVALVAGRYDIVAAVLQQNHPRLAERLRHAFGNSLQDREQARQEAIADIYLVLGEGFSRRIWGLVEGLSSPQARDRLAGLLSEQYVYASLRNARLEQLRREEWLHERAPKEPFDIEAEASDEAHDDEGSRVERMMLESAIEACLRDSPNPDRDRRIIDAMAHGVSMEDLSRETCIPATTLRSSRQKLIAYLRGRLVEEPAT